MTRKPLSEYELPLYNMMGMIPLSVTGPAHKKMTTYELRIATFDKWIFEKTGPKSTDLAHAGFFFSSFPDETCCFYCGIRLRQWTTTDDPIVEHCVWSPYCAFMRIIKGNQFVSHPRSNNIKKEISTTAKTEEKNTIEEPVAELALLSLSTEDKKQIEIPDTLRCKLCMENTIGTSFAPCGHACACRLNCAWAFTSCPICRAKIIGVNRICLLYTSPSPRD